MKRLMIIMAVIYLGVFAVTLTGCQTDANVASHNLSKDAEMFRIERRIVFLNGITDNYILSVEGKCSIDDKGHQLSVTCKTSDTEFKKHYLGLSDNVTYFAEQMDSANVSTYRYKVIFKPSVIVPDVELRM